MKAKYKIVFTKSSVKEINSLENKFIQRVLNSIELLSDNPRPSTSKKLKGSKENLWRLRVGEYRVIYHISDSIRIVSIRRVRHRKDVYRL